MVNDKVRELLITEALKARKMAYAPYSNYLVGAALIVPSGNIYTGCNVENASYGLSNCAANNVIYTGCNIENAGYTPTNCAERTAIFKAVSEGQRHIDAIAITGCHLEHLTDDNNLVADNVDSENEDYAYPCGACRQVLAEFLPDSGDIDVIVAKSITDYKEYKLSELLPGTFRFKKGD